MPRCRRVRLQQTRNALPPRIRGSPVRWKRGLSSIRAQIEAHGVPTEPLMLVRYQNDDDLAKYQPDIAGLPVTFHAAIVARVR
jgi:hypothetical protein